MFENILLAIDWENPTVGLAALPIAIDMARASSSRITIGTVVRDMRVLEQGEGLPISYEHQLVRANSRMQSIVSDLGCEVEPAVEIGTGTICRGVLDVAERISADLIIVNSHDPKFQDRLHAANAARIARWAHCSVLIARMPVHKKRSRLGQHQSAKVGQ